MRDITTLPKAHLHIHFTGSMRVATLIELAKAEDIRLPATLVDTDPFSVPADRRGWYRFQRAYDAARKVVRSEKAMRRIVREAALDDKAEGSVRLELQVDPTSYAPYVGGITPALEIIRDEAQIVSQEIGVHVAIIVASSRIRHPLDARTLARLAAKYAGENPGDIVGFGISNDETRGLTAQWEPAFAIARRAGLPGVPHGGELLGPQHVRETVRYLQPTRLGHGVRASEDPQLLEEITAKGIAFEVCPASNVALGVYASLAHHPLPQIIQAGATIALGADDPLLFLSRLNDQYQIARDLGVDDHGIAKLAKDSINASFANASQKQQWNKQIDAWLKTTP